LPQNRRKDASYQTSSGRFARGVAVNQAQGRSPSMLVLSRQRDETIMIGDDIEITVVDIRGDKVRLGITAPSSVPVHRKEVYEAIKRENRDASQVDPNDLNQANEKMRRSDRDRPPREDRDRPKR
jgi:carbon storage regulator